MNKALEWLRNKRAQGYAPKFKVGDTIFAHNGEFTLLAKIQEVTMNDEPSYEYPGQYTIKYLVNNKRISSFNYGAEAVKSIRAIDFKYQLCENPAAFMLLYGKGQTNERS